MVPFLTQLIQNQGLILIILVPLISAPCLLLISNRTVAFSVSLFSTMISLFLAIAIMFIVSDGLVLSYHLGGWAPPLGIEYRVDAANSFVLLIIAIIGVTVLPYARTSITKEIDTKSHPLFYATYLLCFVGLMGSSITGDVFNVFVFLEISSLSTYILVALGSQKNKRALPAAYDYLVLGSIGATFFVIGLGLIYMATGTLNMVDLAQRLSVMEDNRTVRAAFAFILVGMGLKAAIYPLHRWLPDAYSYAPSAVSAFLSATATKVAIYLILRFTFSIFTIDHDYLRIVLQILVLPLAVIGIFVSSFVAFFQIQLKRMLAYSSIAQIGYMLLGIVLLNIGGLSATIIHLFNHALTKGALFLAIGATSFRTDSSSLSSIKGLGKQMPWTSAAIVLGGLSLVGVPGTVGFVSKWILISAALDKGWWLMAILIVASSLITVAYVWRIIEALYLMSEPSESCIKEAPLTLLIPTWIFIIATIGFGIDTHFTVSIAQTAAESLFKGNFCLGTPSLIGLEGR
ncbi:monovalent cation/H+ antiporter subunit D family protein [Candidatus Endowatersipora endosymbiont of Watersipora subatra]|uniref:monovalent cation/H+ antiporter subunit D family protein n=1 Tax=Candidatus Endowatersipora endosymbiont of Watersipora subatra TaxID=3077946 RepID=UPI00312C9A83